MMMRIFNITCTFFLLFLSCTPSGGGDSEFPIIDIEEGLDNFKISNLSDFVSTIRYVPLETHEDFLVSNVIENIYIEDNKIFVNDSEPYLKVFDAKTGKYLYNVGVKGEGPGELPYMYSVDINPYNQIILLCWGKSIHRFDFEGNFLEKTKIPHIDDKEWIRAPVVTIDSHNYAGTIAHYGEEQKNLVILFDGNQQIDGMLKCYENPIQPPNIPGGVWSPFNQGGVFYRAGNKIRYYRGFTDTVYTFNKDLSMFSPLFIIDYGKHKSALNFSKDAENPDLIMISSIREDNRYIFLDFMTSKASPEPFEDEIFRAGRWVKFTNHSIIGILDKGTESFHFLLQSVAGIPGIKNDIDKGIPFFVRNVSSKNQLIDYHHAYKFLELAHALPDKSDSLAKIADQISDEDNPVVIIAE